MDTHAAHHGLPARESTVRSAASPFHSRLARILVVCALLAAAGPLCADPGSQVSTTEGFSESVEGLPEFAAEVWSATVLVDNATIARGSNPTVVDRGQTWASGLVLDITDGPNERQKFALIVTNAHVVRCDQMQCHPRVRFGDSLNGSGEWSYEVEIVSETPAKDLAFLRVLIPDGVPTSVARLAPLAGDRGELLSIGWPNLKLRKKWHGARPRNRGRISKRYSNGSLKDEVPRYPFRAHPGQDAERLSVLFHSADVLPGNSGGPVIDTTGAVVGLNTKIVTTSQNRTDPLAYCYADPEVANVPCFYLALSAEEISEEFSKAFGHRVSGAEYSAPQLPEEETRLSFDDRLGSDDESPS
jgi:S1-C subfamily serine protease